MEETDTTTATPVKTVEVEGLGEVPARFGSQDSLAEYAGNLNDDQFVTLASVLKSRKWTKQELADRVQVLRPDVDILSAPETEDEDDGDE